MTIPFAVRGPARRCFGLLVALCVAASHGVTFASGEDSLAKHLRMQADSLRHEKTLTRAQQRTDSVLRPYAWPKLSPQRQPDVSSPSSLILPWRNAGRLHVLVQTRGTASDSAALLAGAGLDIELGNDSFHLVQGWIPEGGLATLAALEVVQGITPAWPPEPSTGRVTSEGDPASRADLVRQQGYDGSGVVFGVISNGVDSLAASQASGDLASVAVPPDTRCKRGSGDEGTAMLEIVHDLAPGAALLFSGPATSLEMVDTIACLVSAHAKVIVDDVVFFGEPFFQDGPVAQAAATAVAAGASYHTSASNYGAGKYLAENYRPGPSGFHDFDPGAAQDIVDRVVVGPGGLLRCFLQWADPFGGSYNDYDLMVVNPSTGSVLASSTNPQTGFQNPSEMVAFGNPLGTSVLVGVVIRLFAGSSRALKMFCPDFPLQYSSAQFGISGQAARPDVITVAALDAHDAGLNDVEPFSTQGPSPIFFPSAITRPKPDLTAFDGVSTTLSHFNPFFGTSAAAPHSAAVAALLLSKNPALSPAQLQGILTSTAVDIASPGFDNRTGFGRIDALAAANAVSLPTPAPGCSVGSCDDGNFCTDDSCDPSTGCQHVANGASCSDGVPCTVPDRCGGGQCQPGAFVTAASVSTLITAGVNASLAHCATDKRSVVKKVTTPLVKAAKSFSLAELAGAGTKKWTKKVSEAEKSIGTARSKLTKVQAKLSASCVDDLGQAIAAGSLGDACLR